MSFLKSTSSKIALGALGAVGSFALGGILTALFSDTLNYDILPIFHNYRFGEGYVMEVYNDSDLSISLQGNKNFARVRSASLYMPIDGEKISGRLIRRDSFGKDKNGRDDIYYLSGFRRSEIEVLSWTKIKSPSNSAGTFIGRYDTNTETYIGPVTAQSKVGNSADCTLVRQWAIVGPARSSHLFAKTIVDFYENNPTIASGVGWTGAYAKIDPNTAVAQYKAEEAKTTVSTQSKPKDPANQSKSACE